MKQILYMSFVLATLQAVTSCKDNYYIENDLHGMWQVTSVERFSTGEVTEAHGELYYMFQRTMVSLCFNYIDIPESTASYIAHFDILASDSIGMGDFRHSTTGEGNFVNQETKVRIEQLNKFGLYQDYTIFSKQLSRNRLVLTSDSARIVMRRY